MRDRSRAALAWWTIIGSLPALPLAAAPWQVSPTVTTVSPSPRSKGCDVEIPAGPEARPVVLGEGFALYSATSRWIRFYDPGGRLQHEAHLPNAGFTLVASPRGDALVATRALGEGDWEHTVLDGQGRMRWQAELPYDLEFSPSGNFLIAGYDEFSSHQPPTAYDALTGETAWSDPETTGRWYLAAAEDDSVACYQHQRLRLIDLRRGELIWDKSIEAGFIAGVGQFLRSRNGRTLVAQIVETRGTEERRVTRVWDREGRLLWRREVAPVPGLTNGGLLTAVSDGGGLLVLDDLDHLTVVRATDGKEVWRWNERATCCIRLFTDSLLLQQRGERGRLVRFFDDGKAIDRELRLPRTLRLSPRGSWKDGVPRVLALSALDQRICVNEVALDTDETVP